MTGLSRRAVVAAAALGLAGCTAGRTRPRSTPSDDAGGGQVERIEYGEEPAQFGELTRPTGGSRGVVVVVHGGFWRDRYDLSLGRPLARSLVDAGWTAWNLEYRRVGGGGGVPETLDDVAAGIDALADVDGLDPTTVLTLGHSAGGHLATWAAARHRLDRWSPVRVPVTGVVAQAGVLDLDAAVDAGLGAGAVVDFAGRPGASYSSVDPVRQVPLEVPVRCVHGRADDVVPIEQSERYVAAATAAGADARLVAVGGDHFTVVDPASEAWRTTLGLLAELG